MRKTSYFIGMVNEVNSQNFAVIQFLNRGPKNIFCWPRVDDVATVDAEYVFASHLEVTTGAGRRPIHSVIQLEYIVELYNSFKQKNF